VVPATAQSDFEAEPIRYMEAPVDDRVARLIGQIDAGEVALTWHETRGWLPSLLDVLQVSPSSQLLVFSKTSLQLTRIAPSKPRALYYNDDTYVGWVQRGDVLELAAVDPTQGTIFYTVSQKESARPEFRRDRGQCIVCHASSRTKDVPGLLVRSVFPARDGQPHFGLGTTTTDHRTPFSERFGGWYVTGTHGDMRHRGNAIAVDSGSDPIDPEPGANRTTLEGLTRIRPYMEPGSDLVALMLLEYQSQAHNAITRAGFETRRATHYDGVMNQALDRPDDFQSDSTVRRIRSAAEDLLTYLFYCDECTLTSPVHGTSDFAAEFERGGPRDRRNRSLREFDLKTRLFRYPCSYLVYSEAFDRLPEPMRDHVESRMVEILTGRDTSPEFAHLTPADRLAIREILSDTRPRFAALFHAAAAAPEISAE